jgi:hypothetical protein
LLAKSLEKINDNSDTAVITFYEETMLIRQVTLNEFETRVKKFVYDSSTVTLKQLKAAFSGHSFLERILEDKESVDWRLLFDENFLD